MLDTPSIVDTPLQITASIALLVPRADIGRAMGPAHRELRAVLEAQGVKPVGPWFTHHFRRPTDSFDFEICWAVDRPVIESGRVKPGSLPAARVARSIYRGPYEGLSAAWGGLEAWIAANGLRSATELWECYLSGPESGTDPGRWQTELNRPLLA